MLNLMSVGDISQKPFDEIIELCRKYSCSKSKARKGVRSIKQEGGSVTIIELGNLLENFKTNILGMISYQNDSMNIKKKFEDKALTIFCSRCKKRHPLKNCPLNVVSLCSLCAEDHETDNFLRFLDCNPSTRGQMSQQDKLCKEHKINHGK